MPSQEAFDNLEKFDRLMALGPDEPIPNDDDTTFFRNRVIEKWFSEPDNAAAESDEDLIDQDQPQDLQTVLNIEH